MKMVDVNVQRAAAGAVVNGRQKLTHFRPQSVV